MGGIKEKTMLYISNIELLTSNSSVTIERLHKFGGDFFTNDSRCKFLMLAGHNDVGNDNFLYKLN